jgi:sulfotransferase family protein
MKAIELAGRAARKGAAMRSRCASRYVVSIGKADPDVIFIAGTGRSGTTWLAELLARGSRRRLIFEPFRNDRVPLWADAATRQYIRPGDSGTTLLEPARQILEGDARNPWFDLYNERILTMGRIVKDIRANLMLRWLYERLGPFPIVYVIRHPGAVAASWRREGWTVSLRGELLSQQRLVEDFLEPVADQMKSEQDPQRQIIYLWCVETYVVLRQFSHGEVLIVFYEDVIAQPEVELRRIAQHCGIRLADPGQRLAEPSVTTHPGTRYASQPERVLAWRDNLSQREAEEVTSIAMRFGLDELYDEDGRPNRNPPGGMSVPSVASIGR